MGALPHHPLPPLPTKKSINITTIHHNMNRPKLPSAHNKKKAPCWRHSSSSSPRLCSLSMLLVTLFLFGSVPPAPPIGLLSMQFPMDDHHERVFPRHDGKMTILPSNTTLLSIKDSSTVSSPTTASSDENAKTSSSSITCFHKHTVAIDCEMSYLATFPGSGSELCLELIEGLTGIPTGHAYPFVPRHINNNTNTTHQKVVTIKTHYPNKMLRGGNPKHNPLRVTRAILLLRNPMHALPSFFNFVHEQKSRQRHHYFQAPVEEWIAWRDDDFSSKLNAWRSHLDYWLSQYQLLPASVSFAGSASTSTTMTSNNDALLSQKEGNNNNTMILIGFEDLVNKAKGPLVLQGLSQYLHQLENVTAITSPFQVACAWDQIVIRRSANKRGDNRGNKRRRRQRKTMDDRYVPPYRHEQLQEMMDMLQIQRDRYQDQYPQLVGLLNQYIGVVHDRWLRQSQNASVTTTQ